MCKLRLFRTINTTIYDRMVECKDISINPIDRPAYVIYAPKDGWHYLNFTFSNEKEAKKMVEVNDIILEYGRNSGRIYFAWSHANVLNETDIFNLIERVKADNEHYTERFIQNIRSFIAIVNVLLSFVVNNPIQGEESSCEGEAPHESAKGMI